MSRASVLARGRQAALASMVDTCTIRRKTGQTTDPDTGITTPTLSTIYTGQCRVQIRGRGVTRPEEDVGEAYLLLLQVELQLPMTAVGLEVRDEATIDSSESDPDLVDRVFSVRDLAHKTDATARRVGCMEVTS